MFKSMFKLWVLCAGLYALIIICVILTCMPGTAHAQNTDQANGPWTSDGEASFVDEIAPNPDNVPPRPFCFVNLGGEMRCVTKRAVCMTDAECTEWEEHHGAE